ncbi:MAG TPA: flagellar FlbD family protein [Candidatus Sulfopaludibacter sp.]|nr:flagellar FlbD family protein [Candidatus Sulfopaludibacter sp.]
MIRLTRLNRAPMVLNSDLIEHIDVTPDTVITLTTGQILRVRETPDQVIDRIVRFRRRIFAEEPEGEPDRWGGTAVEEEEDPESAEQESPDRIA